MLELRISNCEEDSNQQLIPRHIRLRHTFDSIALLISLLMKLKTQPLNAGAFLHKTVSYIINLKLENMSTYTINNLSSVSG